MRVFITGASGWIGSHVTDELLAHGYEVTGLARSDASAASVEAKGARVQRGDLDDLDSLRAGAADADAVIHLANKHDFADPAVSNKAERDAVQTFVDALAGSDRRLLFASGVAGLGKDRPSLETDASPHRGLESPRGGAENLALDAVAQGIGSIALRFSPTTHGAGDHGFIRELVEAARRQGAAGYVGDGSNGWAAVHVSDAARMVRLGLEKAPVGARLHAVGEQSVSTRAIAEAIGAGLGVPVVSIAPDDVMGHFGWIGTFFAMDLPASSTATQQLLGWEPTGPTLLEDLGGTSYFS